MFILHDIGLAILGSILFVLMHFLLERLLLWRKLARFNLDGSSVAAIAGLYYGVVSLITTLVFRAISDTWIVPWAIFVSFVLVTVRSWLTALINLIPTLIYTLFIYDINLLTYFVFGAAFVSLIAYVAIEAFLPSRYRKLAMFVIVTISFFITTIAYGVEFHFPISNHYFESTILVPFIFTIPFCLTIYMLRFSTSANILYESITYAISHYYRYDIGHKEIQKAIATQKMQMAIYLLFNYDFERSHDPELNDEMERSILENIRIHAPKNAVFISISASVYGIFIPLPFTRHFSLRQSMTGNNLEFRHTNDCLKEIEQMARAVAITYRTTKNTFVPVTLKIGAALYGAHGCSLQRLEEDAYFALENAFPLGNRVQLFDPHHRRRIIDDSQQVVRMDNALRLDDFEITFTPIFNVTNATVVGVLPNVGNVAQHSWRHSVRDYVAFNGWSELFDRYFAVEALTKFAHAPVAAQTFIDYAPFGITVLDFREIIHKLKRLNLAPQQVVFVIDNFTNLKILTINANAASEHGFAFAFRNPPHQVNLQRLSPQWIIVSPSHFHEEMTYNLEKVIFADIANIEQLRQALNRHASLVSGKALLDIADLNKITTTATASFHAAMVVMEGN